MEDEQDFASVPDLVECDKDNEVVYYIQEKDGIFNHKDHNGGNLSDILLNNQSTVHITMNPQFLTNSKKAKQVLSGICKEEKIQVLLHENEVSNQIEALTVIEQSNEYVDHVKAKQFTQYSIKKGLKEISNEGKQYIIKELGNMICLKVFGKVVCE